MLSRLLILAQTTIIILLFAFGGYLALIVLVTSYAQRELGLEIGQVNIGWNRLVLKDITSIGKKSPTLKLVAIKFRYNELKEKHLRRLMIMGLKADIVLGPKGAKTNEDELIAFATNPPFSVDQIILKQAQIKLTHPELGVQTFQLKAQATLPSTGGPSATATIKLKDQKIIQGAEGHLSISWPHAKAQLSVKKITLDALPFPVKLAITANYTLGKQATFKGHVADQKNVKLILLQGHYKPPETAELTFDIPPLELHPKTKPLASFWYDMPKEIRNVSGTVKGSGKVQWQAGKLTQEMTLSLRNGAGTIQDIPVKGVKGDIRFAQLWPDLQTNGVQRVDIDTITTPVPLSQAKISYSIHPKSGIRVHKASANISSGRIRTANIKVDPLPASQKFIVQLEKIPLNHLVTISEVDDLSVTGTISGTLPFVLKKDFQFFIEQGHIETDGMGHMSYMSPAGLPPKASPLRIVAQAFQDFHFHKFAADIMKEPGQDMRVTLDIRGKNPKVFKGRPLHFNVNLSGKLIEIIETTWKSFMWDLESLRLHSQKPKDSSNEK